MAPLSFSPTTSISSHTLSAGSMQHSNGHNANVLSQAMFSSTQDLLTTLSAAQHIFLQPPSSLHNAALQVAKRFLDPLASGVSEVQQERLREGRKRKRGGDHEDILRIKKVHVDDFGVDQVWEQARRVLDAARQEVERNMPEEISVPNGHINSVKRVRFGEEDTEEDEEEDLQPGSELGEEGVDWEYEGEDVSGEEDVDDEEDDGFDGFGSEDEVLGDGEEIEMGDDDYEDSDLDDQSAEKFVPDKFGLNDGFFSIDDFNRQADFLEQQDARGDPDDGAASDEEEIDWQADPLSMDPRAGRPNARDQSEEQESSEDEEDGPTFGDVDLHAPEGASDNGLSDDDLEDEDMGGLSGLSNTNNVTYADFFAPPARKASKNKKKRGRPNPHNFPAGYEKGASKEGQEEDIQRTMDGVHRDLFDDEDPLDSEDPLSDLDPSDPKSRRSTHERRQAKLAEEIRKLEAKNVAKREWVLSGEARAADRPLNSLLEEDLDFERTGKPVPVITAEVSEDIEALVKRRILAHEFDEVLRRRPDDLATGSVRRGRFELEDTKATKGLAEEYEEEHLKRNDPNYVDPRDAKLKKEHAEIEALWKDICGKLDSLSSWHYKPKPVVPNLEIRVDAPAISMEDARPTAGAEVGGASMLAPQEVYRPGEEKSKSEVVTKAGLPVAKEEMSREERKRRRRREKERLKKASGNAPPTKETKISKDNEAFNQLKKGGVKIIGKKGELRDVEGKLIKDGQGVKTGGAFKL